MKTIRCPILSIVTGLFVALPLGCRAPGAADPPATFGIDFHLPAGSTASGALLFIVDGVNAATFQELLEAGELPSIQQYLLDRGLYVPRAAASHPSLTMNNLMSLVTGKFPGHHGLVAAKWFDRNRLIYRNYETLADKNKLDDDCHLGPATLYEQFPDRLTFSLFLQAHRGATHFYENRISAGPAVAFGLHGVVDRLALGRLRDTMALARRYGQFPAIITIYQLEVNFTAYDDGASSAGYRAAIREWDQQFGRVLADFARAGLLDQIVVGFVSDHGHCDTPLHGKIREYVESLGIPLAETEPAGEELSFEERLRRFGNAAGMPYGPGDRYWVLYLRKPVRNGDRATLADWLERPTPEDLRSYPGRSGPADLPALLAQLPYVDAVAYHSGPDTVRVVRKTGEVEFRRISPGRIGLAGSGGVPTSAGEQLAYRLVSGSDPLEWAGHVPDAALAGEPLTGRQWLEATAQTEFPDLPTGLLSYYDAVLAADLVVFPTPQWDFDGWRHAGHGGIRAAEVFAPLLLAGPGIPHGRIPVARTVDLMPTVLEALGRPVPAGLDGESLLRRVQP